MCPFVDSADSRCGEHLTLNQLAWALENCAYNFCQCQIHRELIKNAQARKQSEQRVLVAG